MWKAAVLALALLGAASPARAGETIVYTYDTLGRVLSARTNSWLTTYAYDAAGNRTTVSSQAVSSSGTLWGYFTWGAANWSS